MKSRKAKRHRQDNSARIHIEISKGMKFTTLPSADVLLDPDMVKEILAAREKEMEQEGKSGKALSKVG